ncbi:DUF3466 family protein [Paraglaciecola aquimarina]|uniref:DUF3466 family protein n=1 Tax=Paraglaciecola aquimarina TaxID=1235557 RepID=A0ABU3STA3_9ALTE|nr:DUF3466 family protein [Paraglaciecola aquimarina]MDU0353239.1 DUF3466 family protein [Paraglaciecola aquimarina]
MKQTRLAVWSLFTLLVIPETYGAQYRVVELPVAELGTSTFPTAINSIGDITVNMQLQYNPYIDTSLIDFESSTVINNLTNLDGVRGGDLNNQDYLWLYSYITSNSQNLFFQQIANLNGYVDNASTTELIHGFDTFDFVSDEYINSAAVNVRSINNSGSVVGTSQDGFYNLTIFTDDAQSLTYVVNDFYSRAFAKIDDRTTALPPPDTTGGGLSDAYDINVNNQVVGVGTTQFMDSSFQTAVDSCLGDEACLRSLSIQLAGNVGTVAQRRGIIWQLDDSGNLTDTFTLGMLIEPDSSDTSIYSSTAVAINDNGIAVGVSPAFYQNTTSLTTAAAIYIDDQVTTINLDEEALASKATDINNNNIMVGSTTKRVLGVTRTKFFVHDVDSNLTIFPDDFSHGSSSNALSINNQNMVVGYGESETILTTRRTEGFIYDYRNDIFSGLNSLTECNSPYYIAQANAINDNNEIAATALVSAPAKNIKGEIIYDELGATTNVDQVVAVKLVPIEGGSIDNCDAYEEVPERQGASMSIWMLLFGMFSLACKGLIRKRNLTGFQKTK